MTWPRQLVPMRWVAPSWSAPQLVTGCVRLYDGLRYGVGLLISLALVGAMAWALTGSVLQPRWSAQVGLAGLTVGVMMLFANLLLPLWALALMGRVLRLTGLERLVVEQTLLDPAAPNPFLFGVLPASVPRLVDHLWAQAATDLVRSWPLAFWQQVAHVRGPTVALVRTFARPLGPPRPGQAVPGLVAFALRSPDREEREWALRWVGTAVGGGAP